MGTLDRIKQYIDFKGLTNQKFEKKVGFSNGAFSSQLKNNRTIGVDKLENILINYPEINPEWLLTGKGEMLKDEGASMIAESRPAYNSGKVIPVIPLGAVAGIAGEELQIDSYDITEGYVVPEFEEKGVKYLIRVSGSSMYPKYSNGDLLACKPVTDNTFFQWGKCYVLDTDQGPLVKRVFPIDNDDYFLECRSENHERYPPFKIKKESIYRIAIIMGVIRLE